jgi:hypothetical protein
MLLTGRIKACSFFLRLRRAVSQYIAIVAKGQVYFLPPIFNWRNQFIAEVLRLRSTTEVGIMVLKIIFVLRPNLIIVLVNYYLCVTEYFGCT